MARGGHGLPKVLLGPAMPNPLMPCGRPALRWLQGKQPAAVFYPLGHATPYAFEREHETIKQC
jgi:hypothetical protein